MQIKIASESAFIIYCYETIAEDNTAVISHLCKLLKAKFNNFIIDIVPSYVSILVHFDILKIDFQDFQQQVQALIDNLDFSEQQILKQQKLIKIPVYYDNETGLDLESLAKEKALSIEDIIKIHSEKTYTAFATGFTLGFAYLGILDPRLVSARLASPRKRIAANSLAIAENQTAIYPIDSPGGWKILGKTPIQLFDKNKANPNLINVGDKVQFQPITRVEFIKLGGKL